MFLGSDPSKESVCVRACVRACVRVCVCECVRACVFVLRIGENEAIFDWGIT